jgi:hypothetical protein
MSDLSGTEVIWVLALILFWVAMIVRDDWRR